MARSSSNGTAQSITAQDFNERVKRLLDKQPAAKAPTAKESAKRLLRGAPQAKS
jgi:hypothetical protein